MFCQSVCYYVSLSVVLSVRLLFCPSVVLSVCCSVRPSVSVLIVLSVGQFFPLSVRLFVHQSTWCFSVCLFFYHSICWCVSLSVSLQVRLLVYPYWYGCFWYVCLSHLEIHKILINFKMQNWSEKYLPKNTSCIFKQHIHPNNVRSTNTKKIYCQQINTSLMWRRRRREQWSLTGR